MYPFDYLAPTALADAAAVWADHGATARLLAGGTDLNVALRHGAVATDLVIDLKHVAELNAAISRGDEGLRIAAGTTMTALRTYLAEHDLFPSLQEAAAVVGSIQIRNRATLVGNVCNASPAADTVPVLAALGAQVEIYGPKGRRSQPVEAFIEGNRQIDLQPGEIVTAVTIPIADSTQGCAFDRITRRRGVDLATVNVGCRIDADGDVVLACGAVSPRPLVLRDETGVLGDPLAAPEDRAPAIQALVTQARPISDVRASADYRVAMLSVIAERAVSRAHARLSGGAAHA